MSSRERDIRYIYDRVLRDARRILGAWPAEQKPISRLLREEKPLIRLVGGGTHLLDRGELEDMASRIPWFMHELVRLPIVIVYRRIAGSGVYRVEGDVWAARAVSVLLGGGYWEEKWELSYEEVSELIKRYKTLFFVTIRVEIQGLLEHEEL
ncbi:DUF61 family protein [Pyrolobus fumarii]|uniref:DUF61 family protein n=1 Tax=Pyrolobus fumarii TaxID=54252 RepID=UPI001433267D|nr:DUF61 family protein [Pyrolobus fumarii]